MLSPQDIITEKRISKHKIDQISDQNQIVRVKKANLSLTGGFEPAKKPQVSASLNPEKLKKFIQTTGGITKTDGDMQVKIFN